MTISQFLQGWGAIIIAFIALVQPLLIWTYRQLFLQGNVVITERMRPEVGFTVMGPTMGLTGVMLCEKQTAFVTELRAVVTRIRDGSMHTFSWQANAPKRSTTKAERKSPARSRCHFFSRLTRRDRMTS